jgi:hypothetical protein
VLHAGLLLLPNKSASFELDTSEQSSFFYLMISGDFVVAA